MSLLPKRRLGAIAMCTFGLFVLVSRADAESTKPITPTKLRVTVLETLSQGPFFIADERGFFAAEGIEIDALTFRDNSKSLPGLAAGDIDVYMGMISPGILNLIARTDQVKIALARHGENPDGCPSHALVAKRELVESGRLKTAADLRGRRLSTERTDATYYTISKLLESAGLTLNDVKPTPLPSRLKPEAFERDLVDVCAASEPYLTRILEGGSAVIWLPTRDIVPDFQYGFLLFGPNLLVRDRDAGRRFVAAYLRGVRTYTAEGKTDQNADIIAKRLRLDADLVKRMCWPHHAVDGRVDEKSLDRFQKWAVGQGLLDRALPAAEVWDRSFVDDANRRLDQE